MATRKDLLKAEAFTSRRMIAAFVDRDPDDPTPPLRRVGTATFVSVLLGVVLLAGTALIGLLRGGATTDSWASQSNVILVDTQAGALFVYDGTNLVPMADVASARLKAAGDDPQGAPPVIEVKTEGLQDYEQLPIEGIPGAPRQLPAANTMKGYPIRLCSAAPTSAGRYLTLEFDATASSEAGISVVAQASDGTQYLISGGKAHELWRKAGAWSALVEEVPVVEPGNAWIDAIPKGIPIRPVEVPGYGDEPIHNPLGLRIGQLAMVEGTQGANPRYFIQLNEGLSQISYLDMQLLRAENADSTNPREISESSLASARHKEIEIFSDPDIPLDKPVGPEGVGSLASSSVCATYGSENPNKVTLSVGQPTPEIPPQLPLTGNAIDLVAMEPLTGALLRDVDAVEGDSATTLVLDGKGYPIPTMAARKALGYGDVQPAAVPGSLIKLLRNGLTTPGAALEASAVGRL